MTARPSSVSAPPASAAQQAADWLVALDADSAAERAAARAGYEAWKRADPRHAAAAAPMEALLQQLDPLRHDDASARAAQHALRAGAHASAIHARHRGRRTTLLACSAAVMMLALATGHLLLRSEWGRALHADLRTAPGEWAQRTLPDGTQLTLGSGSAVDWHFDTRERRLQLLRGEVLVEVAPDTNRPLVVHTPQARIRALGTHLLVQREAESTRLTLLESAAAVQADPPATPRETVVRTGQQVEVSAGDVRARPPVDAQRLRRDWERRELVVIDRPLPEVLRTLARHRRGHLGFDEAQLAHLRVTAVLPLDQPEQALQLLGQSFPALQVNRFMDYWVTVGLPRHSRG